MDRTPFVLDGGLATELEANGFQLQVLTIIQTVHFIFNKNIITHVWFYREIHCGVQDFCIQTQRPLRRSIIGNVMHKMAKKTCAQIFYFVSKLSFF